MGETLPFLLWRIDRRTKAFATGPTITPSEIFKKNIAITTSGVFADQPLLCSLAEIGDDNILYSVDHPFEIMEEAGLWFDKTPISSGNEREDMRGEMPADCSMCEGAL